MSGIRRHAHPGTLKGVPPPGRATIIDRTDLTEALAFFHVRPELAAKPFVPGQYVTIGLETAQGVVERPYSITSSARRTGDDYELYIRLVPGGALTPSLFATRVGDRVTFRPPKGRFTLAPDDGRVSLFVATGCGIAPFISILRTLHDAGEHRRIVLVHGVSYVRELAYRELLEGFASVQHALTYIPTVSRPQAPENQGWAGSTGRAEAVVGPLCERLSLAPANTVAYVCGNPEMTTSVRDLLTARGFAAAQVHVEEYWPPATRATGNA